MQSALIVLPICEYMPVGLYTRKGANGRRMYFRDGKLISKESYDRSRKRKRSTRKGMRRTTARRAFTGNPKRRYMKSIPHPSVTGLASGAIIANYLNEGNTPGTTVIGALSQGDLQRAGQRLLDYAPALVTTPQGQKALVTATGIAILGTMARKFIPNVKLGSTKVYARI